MMRCTGTAIVAAALLVPASASADAGADDVASLLAQLNDEHAALSMQDCIVACKAAASIRRAADKICDLEPGPRCKDARAKADDAHRRVQAACPDCHLAAASPKDEERRAATKGGDVEENEPAPRLAKSAPGRGGCGSCSATNERPAGDVAIAFLGVFALARVLGRRGAGRRLDRSTPRSE